MGSKIGTSLLALTLLFFGQGNTEAQQTAKIPRIGILIPESGPSESQTIKGLREGLKELGYKERESVTLEIRDTKGDRTALKPAADELVNKKVDVIFTTGTRATQAAKAATSQISIVFRHPADPVALGLVKSMTRPGGNITGVTGLSLQATEKRMELLKEIVPNLQRVYIFYDSNSKSSKENFAAAKKAATKLRLEVAERAIKSVQELKSSISSMQKRDGDAFFHVEDELVESQADFIFEAARQKRLPTIFERVVWATRGSLIGHGPDYHQMGRQAARLVDKILKGEKPANLPVEVAKKFDLYINLRTASIIGLKIPPETLKKADRVIR